MSTKMAEKPKNDLQDDSEGVNVIAKELERVIQQKARKRYNPRPTLVVWLNLDKQEIEESDVVAVLEHSRSKYAGIIRKNSYPLERKGPLNLAGDRDQGSPKSPCNRKSLRLDARRLDDRGPLRGFVGDQPGELGARHRHRQASELGEPRLQPGVGERRLDLAGEPVDDLGRRAARDADAGPVRHLVARQRLGDGGNVGATSSRAAMVTPSARSRPARMCSIEEVMGRIMTWTRPPIRSLSAGAAPR